MVLHAEQLHGSGSTILAECASSLLMLRTRDRAVHGNAAFTRLHVPKGSQDTTSDEDDDGPTLSPRSTQRDYEASNRLLQEGWPIHRIWQDNDPRCQGRLMDRCDPPCRKRRYDDIEGGIPTDLSYALQNYHEYPSLQLNATRRGSPTRVVVRANWNRQIPEGMDGLPESLLQGSQQMVGRLLRGRRCGNRGMGTQERDDGGQTQDMGRPLPVPSGNQGRNTYESQAYQDHRNEQLHYRRMLPQRTGQWTVEAPL